MTSQQTPISQDGHRRNDAGGRAFRRAKWCLQMSTVASAALILPLAQAAAQPVSGRDLVPNPTSGGAMINLVLQMVKQGSISPANGSILIQEALAGNPPASPMQQANAQGLAYPQGYAQQPSLPNTQLAAAEPRAPRKGRPTLRPVTGIAGRPQAAPAAPSGSAPAAPAQAAAFQQPVQVPAYQPAPQQQVQTPPIAQPMTPQPSLPPSAAPSQALAAAPAAMPPAPMPPVAPPAVPAAAPVAPPAAPVIRVSYVPESVRKQIKEEIREEVMTQARQEGWAAPGDASPDWVRRIALSGDIRFRSHSELFAKGNVNDLLDYAAFNNVVGGSDITNVQNLAFLNTTQDRWNRMRIRARLDITAVVSPSIEVGMRIASGDDPSPISTYQSLGGGLAKRDLWLDRAYLKVNPTGWADSVFGRFANPFRSTELMFDDDLNFDGILTEVRADKWLPDTTRVTLRGGAFPLDYGSSNHPSTETTKRKYPSKWLFSGQIEGEYAPSDALRFNFGAAYHIFHNVQGQLSDSCPFNGVTDKNQAGNGTVAADPVECSTDGTRAVFPRKGNTLFFIRNLTTPDVNGVALERQYLGLIYKYRVLDLNFSSTAALNDSGINATLSANYLRNLGFKRSDECRYGTTIGPFTNVKVTSGIGNACAGQGVVQSGNEGWMVNLGVGHDRPRKWGEWRAQAGYRYLQTDATLDSLADSDFHLGGTNAKGYSVGGTVGLFDGLSLTGRWLSANEISGPPLSIDVFQIDLQAEF